MKRMNLRTKHRRTHRKNLPSFLSLLRKNLEKKVLMMNPIQTKEKIWIQNI